MGTCWVPALQAPAAAGTVGGPFTERLFIVPFLPDRDPRGQGPTPAP